MPAGKQERKEVAKMYYTGIDLHKKTSFLTTIDDNGKIVANVKYVPNFTHFLKVFLKLFA